MMLRVVLYFQFLTGSLADQVSFLEVTVWLAYWLYLILIELYVILAGFLYFPTFNVSVEFLPVDLRLRDQIPDLLLNS